MSASALTILAEHCTFGACESTIVIENVQDAVLLAGSLAEQSRRVVPTGNVVCPNSGHVTVTEPLRSVAVA